MTAEYTRSNTDWFYQSKWGVMCHYLAAPPSSRNAPPMTTGEWNRRVDSFDVKRLADQLASAHAPYLLFTIGQCTGFFCSPNETYDARVPHSPGRLSQRDLIADLYEALEPRGIKLLAYLPSHAPSADPVAVAALKCTPKWDASRWQLHPGRYLADDDTDERLSVFQRHWEDIIREWSLRWGRHVHGWWFDGCYYADRMYRNTDAPNFRSFAEAAKAGNPDSIVAFNPGVKVPVICYSEFEDYTAGELSWGLPARMDSHWNNPDKPETYWQKPHGRFIDGAQAHFLTFMGEFWCGGHAPRFPDAMTIGYTQHVHQSGAVLTWDIPIGCGGAENGLIPAPFLRQLQALGHAMDRR